MKLNLLPTYVGRGKQLTLFIVVGVMMVLVSFGMSFVMVKKAQANLDKMTAEARAFDKPVDDAEAYSEKVGAIVAPLHDLVRNINLADAMDKHNTVYPDFYDKMIPYIPGFFRITNLQANPIDGNTCTLRMTGVLKTREQYRLLLLSLLRIPGATSVVRSGFTAEPAPFLPGLTEAVQNPGIIDAKHPPLPIDPQERLQALIAQGNRRKPGPQGSYGLGGDARELGPIPDYQTVTVAIALPGNLQTPNPSQTLGVAGGGGGRGNSGGGKSAGGAAAG